MGAKLVAKEWKHAIVMQLDMIWKWLGHSSENSAGTECCRCLPHTPRCSTLSMKFPNKRVQSCDIKFVGSPHQRTAAARRGVRVILLQSFREIEPSRAWWSVTGYQEGSQLPWWLCVSRISPQVGYRTNLSQEMHELPSGISLNYWNLSIQWTYICGCCKQLLSWHSV